jgi:ATP-dependent DNA ligase
VTAAISPRARFVIARARLEDVVAGSELVFPVRRLAADGLVAWQQVFNRGYEGYVAKDETSTYEGGPTQRWLKVKVSGWTIGDERRTRQISVAPGGWPTSGTAR